MILDVLKREVGVTKLSDKKIQLEYDVNIISFSGEKRVIVDTFKMKFRYKLDVEGKLSEL
jgi:hypothetical protein